MVVPTSSKQSWLHRLKNALQNADLACIGQWPRLLRLLTIAFVGAGLLYLLWISQLEAAYYHHVRLAEQVRTLAQELPSLQAQSRLNTSTLRTGAKPESDSALEHLHQMLQVHKIQLIRIQQSPEDKKSKSNPKWNLQIQASYAQWRAWIQSLPSQSRLWDVVQWDLKRAKANASNAVLQIRMAMVDVGLRRFVSAQQSGVLQNPAALRASADSQYLFVSAPSNFKPMPKPATADTASDLASQADTGLLLLGTVRLPQTLPSIEGSVTSQATYQAVIRQGQRIHMLEQGQTFFEKNSAKQWRLEAVTARSAMLRDTQSTLSKSLVLGKPDQNQSAPDRNRQNQMP